MKTIVLLTSLRRRVTSSCMSPDQRVEGGERLVEEQDVRVGGERPSEADPLLHPPAQLVGPPATQSAEPHEPEHLFRLRPPLGLADLLHLQPEGDVVDEGAVRQQAEVLEHHARPGGAAARAAPRGWRS